MSCCNCEEQDGFGDWNRQTTHEREEHEKVL